MITTIQCHHVNKYNKRAGGPSISNKLAPTWDPKNEGSPISG